MIILITGGADSGKSTYAEKIIQKLGVDNLYIATMEKESSEAAARIMKHRKMREHLNIDTLERKKYFYNNEYVLFKDKTLNNGNKKIFEDTENVNNLQKSSNIKDYFKISKSIKDYDAVLLECIGNLVANHMFSDSFNKGYEEIYSELKKDVDYLINNSKNIIFVTNEVSNEIIDYSEETIDYIKTINKISSYIAFKGDILVEVVHGFAKFIKGKDIFE